MISNTIIFVHCDSLRNVKIDYSGRGSLQTFTLRNIRWPQFSFNGFGFMKTLIKLCRFLQNSFSFHTQMKTYNLERLLKETLFILAVHSSVSMNRCQCSCLMRCLWAWKYDNNFLWVEQTMSWQFKFNPDCSKWNHILIFSHWDKVLMWFLCVYSFRKDLSPEVG